MSKNTGKRTKKRSSTVEKTPYEILEVPEIASFEEIRKAYLRKVRLSPPERDPEGFKEIRKAYGVLKDSAKRKELDLSLFRTESDLGINRDAAFDFTSLFKDRTFQLLLASSDFYVKNFSRGFQYIDERIKRLQ